MSGWIFRWTSRVIPCRTRCPELMNDLTRSFEELGLPPFLQELGSVAIALLDEEGHVLAANQGFLRVAPPQTAGGGWDARALFVNPRLEDVQTLVPYHGGALLLYRGILNIASADQSSHSLQGHIYRWQQGRLLVAAEYDVQGLEMLGATVMQLNEQLAETQRQLLRANRELQRNEATIRELMLTDPLTGVGNRRRLDEILAEEVESNPRRHEAFCLLIADLDHFKEINERHGCALGDELLKRFAALLRDHCRQSDAVIRLGSEEFVLLLPDTTLVSAVACAERIRQRLEAQPLAPHAERLTASFGVAMWADAESGADALRRADLALRRSKREGRNRVTQSIAPGQSAAPNIGCC